MFKEKDENRIKHSLKETSFIQKYSLSTDYFPGSLRSESRTRGGPSSHTAGEAGVGGEGARSPQTGGQRLGSG